jgi:integrase/recombinase XerC
MTELDGYYKYLKFEKRYSEHTLLAYQKDLEQFSDYLTLDFDLEQISKSNDQMIRSWLASLMDEGVSARTVNRKLSSLKGMFRFMLKQEMISIDPSAKIRGPKQKKRLPVFVEENKMKSMFNEEILKTDDFECVRDYLILELFYATGIRRAELINLKMGDVRINQQQIKVLGKRNKERIIPIGNHIIKTILIYNELRNSAYEEEDFNAYFFITKKGKKLYPKLVYRIVNSYLSHVSTQDKKSPHVLRHTFATHMLNNGADLNAVKEILGHASLAATQIYTHNTIEKLKKVYQQAHPKA